MARKKSVVNQVPQGAATLAMPPISMAQLNRPEFNSLFQSHLTSVRQSAAQQQEDLMPPELRAFIAARAQARGEGRDPTSVSTEGLTRGVFKRHRKSLINGGNSA